jgi:hypothetical protein
MSHVCILGVLLGEFGDYDPAEHGTAYLEDFPLLENRVRSETSVYIRISL